MNHYTVLTALVIGIFTLFSILTVTINERDTKVITACVSSGGEWKANPDKSGAIMECTRK